MKKLFFIVTTGLLVASCGQAPKSASNDTIPADTLATSADTLTTSADTLTTSADTLMPVVGQVDSVKPYAAPDYAMLSLRGRVKSIREVSDECDSKGKVGSGGRLVRKFEFTPEGRIARGIIMPDINIKDFALKRNNQGRIVSGKASNYHQSFEIRYDTENRIAQYLNVHSGEILGESTNRFTYSSDGSISKIVRSGVSDGIEFTYTYNYSIIESDKQGNWTKAMLREVETENTYVYDEEYNSKKQTESRTDHYLVTRKIEYFE